MFQVPDTLTAHLCVYEKLVCVQRRRSSYRLITQNFQICDQNASKVTVYYVNDKKHMAFCFELKNKTTIFPIVTQLGNEIEFKVLSKEELQKNSFDKEFLFQWVMNTDTNRGLLESVAQPKKYLFVGRDSKVTIKSRPLTYFKIEPPQKAHTRGYNKCIAEGKMLRSNNRKKPYSFCSIPSSHLSSL